MKIELDGKVYSYILTKIEDLKSRVDGLSIMLADFGQQVVALGVSIALGVEDASKEDDNLYDSVFDEISSIKSHLDDLHHILTGGRVE
jgi:hypothetical protein